MSGSETLSLVTLRFISAVRDVVALGGDLDGASVPDCLADAAAMPTFQQALLANFGEAVTRKLCYGNALAFFEREGR